MNIWLVNHYAISPGQAGGTRHYTLAKELQRRGHKVTIIASSVDYLSRQDSWLNPGERYRLEDTGGVNFFWIRTPAYSSNSPARVWNMISFAWAAWLYTRPELLGKPDVVLGSSPHPFAALAAERLAHRYGVPFVLEVRDLWPQTLVDLGRISPRHPFILLLDWIERYLYRKARRVVSLLPLAHRHMAEKGADPSKCVWVPNGIDLDLVPEPIPPQPNPEGTFTIMYAGAHGLANNLDRLVEAAEILQRRGLGKRVLFRLVGDGPEKTRLVQLAQERGLTNLRFEKPVAKRDVFRLFSQADGFVMLLKESPLFRWGISPNKLFDYLASARPIVFAVSTEHNPVAEAGAGITVPPEDPEALASAILHLTDLSLEQRWEMGLRGRRYVEEKHALSRLAEKLESVLEGVGHAEAKANAR